MVSRQEFEAFAAKLGKSLTRSAVHNGAYLVPSTEDMWQSYQLGAGMIPGIARELKRNLKWFVVGTSEAHPDRCAMEALFPKGYDLPTRSEIDTAVTARALMPGNYWVADQPALYICGAAERTYIGRVVVICRRG